MVITTRPLPGNELKPLEQAGVDIYAIQPFGRVELEEFARAWFRAQNPITAMTSAEAFVRQVRDGRLRELVRNPLLATIAAIAKTLEPNRPLPNSRIDLYGRFMEYLLEDGASRRDTLAELRRSAGGRPERQALVEWLHQRRTEIIEQLAVHRLESESSLFEAASAWATEHHPYLPDGWQDDLRALLAGTGVFVHTEDDIRFRHHSFAEFLAARRRAGEIPADFPDLDEWIKRGVAEGSRAFALFTLVLWGRDRRDLGRVMSALLAGTKPEVLLAGRLLAEGVEVDDALTSAVVDRLVALILSNGVLPDKWDEVEEAGKVLLSMPPYVLTPPILARLRGLRDHPDPAEPIRVECAVVVGALEDPEVAARWLEEFAVEVNPAMLNRSVAALKDLVPDGVERAERLLTRLVAANGQGYAITLVIVSIMVDAGFTDAATALLRDLVRRLRADPATVDGRPLPAGPWAGRVADLPGASVPTWGALAELAGRCGCRDESLWAAAKVFSAEGTTEVEFDRAVSAVLSVSGEEGVPTIMAAVATKPAGYVVRTAETLQQSLQPEAAVQLARNLLEGSYVNTAQFRRVTSVIADCNGGTELLRLAEAGLSVEHRVSLAKALSGTKHVQDAFRLARSAMVDPAVDRWDFKDAIRVIFDPEDASTADEIYAVARAREPQHQAAAAAVLSGTNHEELAQQLIKNLLDHLTDPDLLADLAAGLIRQNSGQAGELEAAVLGGFGHGQDHRQVRVVEALIAVRRLDEATNAARLATLNGLEDQFWFSHFVGAWVRAGGVVRAGEIVRELLSRDLVAGYRMEMAEQLAGAGLLESAVTVWLDVVRHHGEEVAEGLRAASYLVKCGRRDDVVAVLDEVPDRPAARRLRAWVMA